MRCTLRRAGAVGFAFFLLVAAAPPAPAQVQSLDKTTFIEGLRKEGLGDLLKHLVATEPTDDPVLNRQIVINQLLLDYDERMAAAREARDPEQAASLRAQALQAFNQAIEERRNLIRSFDSHEQRPLWQTDLAEQLLFEHLQLLHQNAADFCEFGVPTVEQREAFDAAVPEAFELLAQADRRFFDLQGELPKEADHTAKRMNTGLWDRMMNQYYALRTQYLLGYASYYASLLPDAHPYYQSLGNPRIPNQRRDPAEERSRLRSMAVERLQKFTGDSDDEYDIRRPSQSVSGRALSALGQHDEALAVLAQAISGGAADPVDLIARLGHAVALDRKGAIGDALAELSALTGHAMVQSNLLYRLLVTDLEHRLLRERALALPEDKQAAALAEAYEPYQRLLNDPSLSGEAEGLRWFIYRRWESSLPPGEDLTNTPAMVVAAIAEIARDAGVGGMEEAAALEREGNTTAASQERAEAAAKLRRTIDLTRQLLERPDLPGAVAAQAKFSAAIATYYLDQADIGNQLRAAQMLTDVADQHPDQPMAEAAIADALQILRPLRQMATRPEGVDAAYERAASILLAKYPATPAADAERVAYAATVLEPAGRYAEAAEVLARVPSGHESYFAAQRDLIYNLQEAYRAAPPGERDEAAQRVTQEATRVLREAERALPSATGREAAAVRQAAGWARLILADMAVEQNQSVEDALAILRDFDQAFAGEADLIRLMLQKRILAQLQANQMEQAVAESKRMMASFPDDAAPVIDRVLTELDRQIEALREAQAAEVVERRKEELGQLIQAKADSAVELAKLLLEWAQDPSRGFTSEDLLAFQLIYAKSLRLAGRHADALAVIEPLLAEHGGNANVIYNAAETYFGTGDPQTMIARAAPLYDQLIRGIQPENGRYPELWWQAWLRRLQIIDRAQQGTGDLPLRIRQLKATDPNLGGEPMRSEFERLLVKYQR